MRSSLLSAHDIWIERIYDCILDAWLIYHPRTLNSIFELDCKNLEDWMFTEG